MQLWGSMQLQMCFAVWAGTGPLYHCSLHHSSWATITCHVSQTHIFEMVLITKNLPACSRFYLFVCLKLSSWNKVWCKDRMHFSPRSQGSAEDCCGLKYNFTDVCFALVGFYVLYGPLWPKQVRSCISCQTEVIEYFKINTTEQWKNWGQKDGKQMATSSWPSTCLAKPFLPTHTAHHDKGNS